MEMRGEEMKERIEVNPNIHFFRKLAGKEEQ
jgi:hypothetical protein